jgi:hypothetical protein
MEQGRLLLQREPEEWILARPLRLLLSLFAIFLFFKRFFIFQKAREPFLK